MSRFTTASRLGLAAATAAGVATLVVSSPAAAVDLPSPMQSCKAGKTGAAPDVTQTVFMSGTSGRAFYPRGVDPDNALFPGDVVQIEISGTLRYDATHTTGPAGTGEPNANGIRPYAATAQWNNNPRGPIGVPMAAVALRGCTAVSGKAGVRIAYGIRDTNLGNNGGGFTITTKVWKAPGRLTIDDTEVTQGVQNREGQVALIGDKRTFVRVYLHHKYDGSDYMEGVSGTLRVPGVPGVTSLVPNTSNTSVTWRAYRGQFEGTLLFELPAAAIHQGSRQAVVTITPPAGRGGGWAVTRHVPLEFGPKTALHVIGVRYSYYNVPPAMATALSPMQPGLTEEAGWWRARTIASWEPQRRMAENALPLAELTITDDAPPADEYSAYGSAWFDCEAAQRPEDGLWYCGGFDDAMTWAYAYADQLCPTGKCVLVVLQPESQLGGGEHGLCRCVALGSGTAAGNTVINVQGEQNLTDQGNTLTHELGHAFGLGHLALPGDPFLDKDYPRANGSLGPMVGLRYTPNLVLVPGLSEYNNRVRAYDLMTYVIATRWFSVYSYCKAMLGVPGNNPHCSPGWNQ